MGYSFWLSEPVLSFTVVDAYISLTRRSKSPEFFKKCYRFTDLSDVSLLEQCRHLHGILITDGVSQTLAFRDPEAPIKQIKRICSANIRSAFVYFTQTLIQERAVPIFLQDPFKSMDIPCIIPVF